MNSQSPPHNPKPNTQSTILESNSNSRIVDILTSIGIHTGLENQKNCATLAVIYANFDSLLIYAPLHLRPQISSSLDHAMGLLQTHLKVSNEHARLIYDATFKDVEDILSQNSPLKP